MGRRGFRVGLRAFSRSIFELPLNGSNEIVTFYSPFGDILLMGRIASLALVIGIISSMGIAQADDITVTDHYASTDIVHSSTSPNAYRLHISDGDSIDYSFSVQGGSGTIEVYFAQGAEIPILNSVYIEYYVAYSTSYPVTSYSNTFTTNSEEGTDFSIFVKTPSSGNITYKVSINVAKPSKDTNYTSLLCGVGFVLVIIYVLLKVVRKNAYREARNACPLCGRQKTINPKTRTPECQYCLQNISAPSDPTPVAVLAPLKDDENAPILFCPKCGCHINKTASKIIICPRCGKL